MFMTTHNTNELDSINLKGCVVVSQTERLASAEIYEMELAVLAIKLQLSIIYKLGGNHTRHETKLMKAE